VGCQKITCMQATWARGYVARLLEYTSRQAGEGDARAVSFKASWPGGGWVQQWEYQGKGPVWRVS
jgi:hypothetical protein